ncbi:MAG TPA: hypothetical protein DCQ31_18435 [Bacteroidales bacterium]|nr:hypothetical protein [Bacteroidales bacterium]
MQPLISPENNLLVFTVIVAVAALGIYSEHKKWFGKISGILITMILMAVLAMLGIVPLASGSDYKVPAYEMVFTYFVPLAIPLMLFSANLKKIIRESGKLLLAFIIGAIGVVLGSFLAFYIIDLGENSGNTAGVIAATLIGGSINFMATGEIMNFTTHPLFSAAIAVDNVAANMYILLLFVIPSLGFMARFFQKPAIENELQEENNEQVQHGITMESIAIALFIAFAIASAGNLIAPYIQQLFGTKLSISILVITVISVLVANLFPKALVKLESTAFVLGLLMMYMFLATIGAATNFSDIFNVGLGVFGFYLIIMFFHLLFVIATAKLFKLNVYEVIVASAANIMGPSVAAPMAASLQQKKMVTPAVLVGILGYVIGTFVGVSIAMVLN